MSAAFASAKGFAHALPEKQRRRVKAAFQVIDKAPIDADTKMLGYLFVRLFGVRGWPVVWTGNDKLGRWLRHDYALKGGQHRSGQRGLGTGKKRAWLSTASIGRRVKKLAEVGLVKVLGGGNTADVRYGTWSRTKFGKARWKASAPVRGLKRAILSAGLLKDALRGRVQAPGKAWARRGATEDLREAEDLRARQDAIERTLDVTPEAKAEAAAKVRAEADRPSPAPAAAASCTCGLLHDRYVCPLHAAAAPGARPVTPEGTASASNAKPPP